MKPACYLIALLLLCGTLRAQDKKTLYQFDANAQLHQSGSLYKTGAGIAAGAYFPISPSFNMGPMASVDFLRIGSPSRSYTPVSLRFTTVWFPERLLNKLYASTLWSAMYFKAGLGHSFNYDVTTSRGVLNSAHFQVGFMLPAKTRSIGIHAGFSQFGTKVYDGVDNPDPSTLVIGVSYNLFKYHAAAKQ